MDFKNMSQKKRILCIAALVLVVVALTLAIYVMTTIEKSPAPPPSDTPTAEPSPTPSPAPSPSPEVSPTPEPGYDGARNPLTGLPTAADLSANRPIAVVINNRKIAQPQLGVSKADIIFEAPVEGGLTRMLAVFQDVTDAGEIGSVRSARLYFIDIAQGFDAIFVHAGGSPGAYAALASRDVTHVDGVNGARTEIFYRDAGRRQTMGYEHSLLTSSAKIAQYFPGYTFRQTHENGYSAGWTFLDDYALAFGEAAAKLAVEFSSSKSTSFTYDGATGLYAASQHGGAYKDGNNGAPLTFANVITLDTKIAQIRNDPEGRLDVTLTGSGTGTLAIGGAYTAIKWSKASETAQFVFTDSAGNPVTLRAGRTYIAVIGSGMKASYS